MKNIKVTYIVYTLASVLFIACHQPLKQEAAGNAAINDNSLQKDSTSQRVKRYGMVTGIKPEKIAYYKELHAHGWPGVTKMITECNIRNYSIYLKQIGSSYYLFSYFEYTGKNFDADMKKMAADTTTQRWWRETDPTQIPLPEALAKKQIWTEMEEVYHQD
ncbi:L-rhamnose mutarotase [Niabella hibiscisoli]|uniref:L-rhamnose mutarotase n=1 Tax=Niabella hibiscisoli TaxID=1825928 RepID=UPI001F10AD49|nr:L-rhamnose mutarotase [Niabella hibiscisoli]MCH5719228.1 L-rhamnose mutarotase [Niabella hibiscisoli]